MTPEEKASLEKIFNFEQLEKIQEVLEKLKNDEGIKNCLTNRTQQYIKPEDLSWYFDELISGTQSMYRIITRHENPLFRNEVEKLDYTKLVFRFLHLQERVYQYQESLRFIRDTIDQSLLFQKTHNNPEKKWLVDAYLLLDQASSNLLQNTVTHGFQHILALDPNVIEDQISLLKDSVTLLTPQNFADYAIDFFIISGLYETHLATLIAGEDETKRRIAEELGQQLQELYHFEGHLSIQNSGAYLRKALGADLNKINEIFATKIQPADLGIDPFLTKLKVAMQKKILQFELPSYAGGVLVFYKKAKIEEYSSDIFSKRPFSTTIYVHPTFIDSLPSEKQILTNGQPGLVTHITPHQAVKISMGVPGNFFTSVYDFGSNSKNGCNTFVYKPDSLGGGVLMTTYTYPVANKDCHLYLDQLAEVDFNKYSYCTYDPCAPEAEANCTLLTNRLQPGSLIPFSKITKGSSAFIAECVGTDSTTRATSINRIIHLFDMDSYK